MRSQVVNSCHALVSGIAFQAFKLLKGAIGIVDYYRLNKLAVYIRGWMGYFGISEEYHEIPEIDGWIQRRMCCWKQWRKCRAKIRELLKLGTIRPEGWQPSPV